MTIVSWATVWPHFTPDEMRCKGTACGATTGTGCGRADMQPAFMDRLEALRFALSKPLVVTSGFRCPAYNVQVSKKGTGLTGPHTKGIAVDIVVDSQFAHEVLRYAFPLGFTGIGDGVEKGFVHLDIMTGGPRPNIWNY